MYLAVEDRDRLLERLTELSAADSRLGTEQAAQLGRALVAQGGWLEPAGREAQAAFKTLDQRDDSALDLEPRLLAGGWQVEAWTPLTASPPTAGRSHPRWILPYRARFGHVWPEPSGPEVALFTGDSGTPPR